MGELLSQLEEKNDKIEKRLWTIERQVAFLNKMYDKMYVEMDRREDHSDAESKQAPPLTFDELVDKYGFLHRDSEDGVGYQVIPTYSVRKWLKINGYVE